MSKQPRNIILLYESETIFKKFCRVFGSRYEIFWGKDLNTTMDILAKRNVGVMVCDIHFHNQDIYPVVLALTQLHPELVTMVVSKSGDAEQLAALETQEEIFVAMVRPITQKQLNDMLDKAFNHYLAQRMIPEAESALEEESSSSEDSPFAGMTLAEALAAKVKMKATENTAEKEDVAALPDDILGLGEFSLSQENPVKEASQAHEAAALPNDILDLDDFGFSKENASEEPVLSQDEDDEIDDFIFFEDVEDDE